MLSPSTYTLGLVFIRTPGTLLSSCSAVLTAIHGPLHLQRSQHYQPPPSLRWHLSSFCLPGLQPLPPPALSLLLFTVPETIQHQTHTLVLVCAVFYVEHLFRTGCVHWSVTETWCLLRSVLMQAGVWVTQCGQTAQQWSSEWAAWAACRQLKALTVCCLFVKFFIVLQQIC